MSQPPNDETQDLELVPAAPAKLPAMLPMRAPEGSMLAAIVSRVTDPTFDVAKLRELIDAGKELEAIEAKKAFAYAMAALQAEMPSIPKNGLIPRKNKPGKPPQKPIPFAKWDDIFRAVQPLLIKHGFAARFSTEVVTVGTTQKLNVTLTLCHIRGHEESSSWSLPAMGDNQYVSNLQNAASPITFGKRYVFCNMLNILTEGVDNDGAEEEPPEPITEQQLETLRNITQACQDKQPGSLGKFRQWVKAEFGVDDPKNLTQGDQYDAVMKHLDQRQRELGLKR